MIRFAPIILITFLESAAVIYTERGIYFFSRKYLGFSDVQNLCIALVFGAAYLVGAMLSHRVTVRLKEKPTVVLIIVFQLVLHLILATWPTAAAVFVGCTLLGFLNGMKWPIIESYVSAGWTPAQAVRKVGSFNITWAMSIPIVLATSGPLIKWDPAAIFLVSAALNVVALILCLAIPRTPPHLPHDHPDRPPALHLPRLRAILNCSRWLMLASYSAMWILAALMPTIFHNLGYEVAAPALSGLLDVVRLAAFVILWLWPGWHGRSAPLGMSMVALAGSFFMILFGGNLVVVLAGEALFGLSMGMIYYSSLYHAMVIKNASVDAGGKHESLIGAGFAIGPIAGLIGVWLAPAMGNEVLGMLVGIGPVFAVCFAGAIIAIIRAKTRSVH